MGISIHSDIIAGERFVKKDTAKEVVRYHETTGKPFTTEIISTSWTSESSPSIEWDEERFEALSLEIYEPEWESDEKFVGIPIISQNDDSENWAFPLEIEEILSKQEEYKKLMKREAKVWSILTIC